MWEDSSNGTLYGQSGHDRYRVLFARIVHGLLRWTHSKSKRESWKQSISDHYHIAAFRYWGSRLLASVGRLGRNDSLQLGCEFRQFALGLDPGFQRDNQWHADRFCAVQQLYSEGYRLEFACPVCVGSACNIDCIRGDRDSGGDCNTVRDVLYS